MYQTIQKLLGALALTALMLTSPVWADFYVIPVNKKIKNVVTVAQSGAQFTDVKTAMDSITDASETNRYLLYVGPGVYTVSAPIQLKAWVTLEGAGEQATLLRGAVSTGSDTTSAIILGANNATLSDLSVENTGGSTYSIGIYNNSSSPTLNHVTVSASGDGFESIGILNLSSSPTLTNVTATASGSTDSFGIFNYSSSPTLTNVTATASGGTDNYGIYNYTSSSPTLTNVTATASGGANNYGIYNYSSSPTLTNVTATASAGSYNYGIYNYSSSPTLTNVTAMALGGTISNYGIRNQLSSSPKIYHSRAMGITDDVYTPSGTPRCVYCVGNNDAELNATCD